MGKAVLWKKRKRNNVPKSVRSVLLDDLVGIRVVLERLGHLSAIAVKLQSTD